MTRVLPIAIVTAVVLSWTAPAAAQAPAAAKPKTATAAKWTPPRTPWGHPDLQGEWTSDSARGIPRERPAEFAGRAELTDQELADRIKRDEQTIKDGLAERVNELDLIFVENAWALPMHLPLDTISSDTAATNTTSTNTLSQHCRAVRIGQGWRRSVYRLLFGVLCDPRHHRTPLFGFRCGRFVRYGSRSWRRGDRIGIGLLRNFFSLAFASETAAGPRRPAAAKTSPK
jgi:hypothetical protein